MNLDHILKDCLYSDYIDDTYYARLRHDLSEWQGMGTPLDEQQRACYEARVVHENWLLDNRHFEQWYQLYSRQCLYWIPAAGWRCEPDEADPQTHVTLAFDDRRRMGDRIVWLRTGMAYSQLPASFTAHSSSNFVLVPSSVPGEVKIRSQFIVHEIRAGHAVQVLAGWMGHVFVEEDGQVRIDRKLVRLLDGERSHHNLTFLL